MALAPFWQSLGQFSVEGLDARQRALRPRSSLRRVHSLTRVKAARGKA
ncbi:hypothetical protein USDA257_p00370 (plasmid) [Sinorhizobium fredii USDA 257]|uniref:Uncharacterized protein n=1 Tax=Sinorhizobium fredii (strain USDA 257) TaxID=1185652 RepID=I3XFV0_SINF2|nr:hypothetical protein USDA257_p00370 [Sinorhizobium fredii USDA 257]